MDIKRYNEAKFERINKRLWNPKRINKYRKYVANLQKRWDKIGNKATLTLSKVSGLDWKEDNVIICYILDTPQSVSDPLTLAISHDFDSDCKAIIRELAHRLEFQNQDKIKWIALNKAFKNETGTPNIIYLYMQI